MKQALPWSKTSSFSTYQGECMLEVGGELIWSQFLPGYMPIIRAIQPTAGPLERSEFGQNPEY